MTNKILIAEDDGFLVKMYQLELGEEQGFDIDIATDGISAIEKIDKNQPDLLLLDLLMPKTDGFGVLEHIQNKGYKFPVIILSNLSKEIDRDRCTKLGAKDYFVKSDMDMDDLTKIIKEYI